MTNERFLTPPKAGRILGVGAEQVLDFIRRGELRASNLSNAIRPRWKINPDDLQAFLDKRSNQQPAKRTRRKVEKPVRKFL